MKNFYLIFLLIFSINVNGQKIDTIVDKGIYKSYYSYVLKSPLYVVYDLYKGGGSVSRKGLRFSNEDKTASNRNYKEINLGYNKYDRGHLANAEDFAYDSYKEALTFSYFNCFPQNRRLNRGVWKIWETTIRQESQKWPLRIYCGGIYTNPINSHSIGIPSYCWKLVINLKTHLILHVLLFKNDDSNSVQRISFSDLKKMLNYTVDFKTN